MRVRACVERIACAAHDARGFSVFLACLSVRTRHHKPRAPRAGSLSRSPARSARESVGAQIQRFSPYRMILLHLFGSGVRVRALRRVARAHDHRIQVLPEWRARAQQ